MPSRGNVWAVRHKWYKPCHFFPYTAIIRVVVAPALGFKPVPVLAQSSGD
jgi:hypothetical protein